MPSINTHILVADKLNEKYKFDYDRFILGNVLPDLYKTSHFKSHFNISYKVYGYNKLLNKYKYYFEKRDPIFIGYLTHLLLDDYVNINFRKKFVIKDNEPVGVIASCAVINSNITEIFFLKHMDLDTYDRKLLDTYNYKSFNNFDILNNMPFIEENRASKERLEIFFNKYNRIINLNNKSFYDYIIYSENEIDDMIENSIDFIDKKINKLLLKK